MSSSAELRWSPTELHDSSSHTSASLALPFPEYPLRTPVFGIDMEMDSGGDDSLGVAEILPFNGLKLRAGQDDLEPLEHERLKISYRLLLYLQSLLRNPRLAGQRVLPKYDRHLKLISRVVEIALREAKKHSISAGKETSKELSETAAVVELVQELIQILFIAYEYGEREEERNQSRDFFEDFFKRFVVYVGELTRQIISQVDAIRSEDIGLSEQETLQILRYMDARAVSTLHEEFRETLDVEIIREALLDHPERARGYLRRLIEEDSATEVDQTLVERLLRCSRLIPDRLDLLRVMASEVDVNFRQEPVFFCNERALRRQVQMLRKTFGGRIAYAVKANPLRRILEILTEEGITHFDVASLAEMEAVTSVQPAAGLLYNNLQTPFEIATATTAFGVRNFTAQTLDGAKRILEYTDTIDPKELEVMVRLRTARNDQALIDFGEKFGATLEEALEIIKFLRKETSVRIGICVHTGSLNADFSSYKAAIEQIVGIARQVQCLKILDLGGGFPANYYGHPQCDVEKLVKTVSDFLHLQIANLGFEEIYIEPGRSVVADAVHWAAPVIEAGEQHLRIRDGVFGSFNAARLHNFPLYLRAFRPTETGLEEILPASERRYRVYGPTCDAEDHVEMHLPDGIQKQDVLCFPSAGAYMAACATTFNGFSPARWVFYNRSEIDEETSTMRAPISAVGREELSAGEPVIEHRTFAELTPVEITEITEFYRFIFNNDYGGKYLVFPRSKKHLSPREVLSFAGEGGIPAEEMDALLAADLPYDPQTKEFATFWRHPRIFRQTLEEKLKREGYMTMMRDQAGRLIGLTFGYMTTLGDAFELEDWRNPLKYAGLEIPEYCLDMEKCFQNLERFVADAPKSLKLEGFPLTPDTEVFCYNCVAIDPSWRGRKIFFEMTKGFFQNLPERHRNEIMISETELGSSACTIFQRAGVVSVSGIFNALGSLQSGDQIFTVARLGEVIESFGLPRRKLMRLVREKNPAN